MHYTINGSLIVNRNVENFVTINNQKVPKKQVENFINFPPPPFVNRSEFNSLRGSINNKANNIETTISGMIYNTENRFNNMETSINNKVNNIETTISGMINRVLILEQTISNLKNELKSEFEPVFDNILKRLSTFVKTDDFNNVLRGLRTFKDETDKQFSFLQNQQKLTQNQQTRINETLNKIKLLITELSSQEQPIQAVNNTQGVTIPVNNTLDINVPGVTIPLNNTPVNNSIEDYIKSLEEGLKYYVDKLKSLQVENPEYEITRKQISDLEQQINILKNNFSRSSEVAP
jgi:hypothetical protein